MNPLRVCLVLARLLLLSGLICFTDAHAQVAFNVTTGWNLFGNSSAAPIDVTATFGDASKIAAVWTRNRVANRWAFYAPTKAVDGTLAGYAAANGYDVLTSIAPKEGFWVNASTAVTLAGPVASGVRLVEGDLPVGWNLAGSADGMTPSQLNQSLASSLNSGGKLILAAWAWDKVNSAWKFHARALEAQGGTVLADYIANNGYRPFTGPLTAADGFWLNIGAGAPTLPDAPTGVTANAGNTQALVSFAAPSNSGFRAITSYTVTSSPGGITATGAASPIVVSGLTNGISYTFAVRATNSVGAGAPSASSASVAPSANPLACWDLTTPLKLAMAASRNSGVAPLAVFFDATSTTSPTVTSRPFHDLEYRWDFGDAAGSPVSGTTWANGSRSGISSRNSATGPVAAHVFETPGNYTVAMSAVDGTNTASCNVQITVQDPDVVFAGANTICFSNGASFAGCPAGAQQVAGSSNFVTAIASAATGKRLLFERGGTWTAAALSRISVAGPGLVGTFGTGARAVVQMTGNESILRLSGAATPGLSDWRVVDLEFDGHLSSSSGVVGSDVTVGIGASGGMDQVVLLRLNIHHVHNGITFDAAALAAPHRTWKQIAIVDSTVANMIGGLGGVGAYIYAQQFAFLGNNINDTSLAEHGLRSPYIGAGVVSNNTISNPRPTKHTMQLHAPPWAGMTTIPASTYTEKVVLSDNKFVGGNTPWTSYIGAQNNTKDERLRDIIVERNWYVSGVATDRGLVAASDNLTVRNNICDMTGGSLGNYSCFDFETRSLPGSQVPNNMWVYNNTGYTNDASAVFRILTLDATVTNVTVKNNLASAPNATTSVIIFGTGASGLVQSNNLVSGTPGFAGPLTTPAGFKLTAGSGPTIIDAGAAIPVLSDFFRLNRLNGSAIDLGAAEF